MAILRIDDFSNGLATGNTELDAPDGYFSVFKGVSRDSGKSCKTRYGSPSFANLTGATSYFYFSGAWYISSGSSIYRNYSGSTTLISGSTSTSASRWAVMAPSPGTSDVLYQCNGGGCHAISGSSSRRWGISPPVSTPTMSSSTGGQLTDGAIYRYAFTYYNSASGCESNPSPVGVIDLVPGATRITVSNLGVSSDSQVTQKRIYRSAAGSGILYYLTSIVNSQTSLVDSTADTSLRVTERLSYDNGAPYESFRDCAGPFVSSMFWITASNGYVYYSRIGYPESVEGYIRVSGGHDPLVRLVIFGGDLYAVSRYGVYQIYGDNPYFSRPIPGAVGTGDPDSVVVTPKGIIWKSYDGIRIFTGGSQSSVVGEQALQYLCSGYDSFRYLTTHATYAFGEYIIGNIYRSLAINLETGRVREIGVPIYSIHHDAYAEVTLFSPTASSGVWSLEVSGSYSDAGSFQTFDVQTKAFITETPVRIATIRVGATITGLNTFLVSLGIGKSAYGISTMEAVTGLGIYDFTVGYISQRFYVRIYSGQVTGVCTIEWIEIEYYPVELLVLGDDPTVIPAVYENGMNTLAFNFNDQKSYEAAKLYKYELLNIDYATSGQSVSLLYTKHAGSNHSIASLSSASRDTGMYVLNFMGIMDRIYFLNNVASYYFRLFNISVYRSVVKLRAYFGDDVIDIPGYLNPSGTDVRFRILTRDRKSLQQAYLYERLTVVGNPASATWNVYLDMLNEAAVFIEAETSSYGTTFQYELAKMGVLDEVSLNGSFTDVSSYLHSAELFARPIVLSCNLGDQAFQIPGHLRDANSGITFDLKDIPAASLDSTWLFERIAYDAYTAASSYFIITLTFQGNYTASYGPEYASTRSQGFFDINRVGRLLKVDIQFSSFNSSSLYQLEIVAVPLVLDLYLDDEKVPVPSFMSGISYIYFDPKSVMDSSPQQVYLFERFLIDGDTNGNSLYPYLKLVASTGYESLGTFLTTDRDVNDFTINKMGRFDSLRLNASWSNAIAIHKLELVAHMVVLEIHINGQKVKAIPSRLRSYSQEMYFEIYAFLQESLQTSYVIDRFFYDIYPNSQRMVFDLQIFGGSDIELLDTSSGSKTSGEVNITTPGRPSNLTITSDFTQFDQAVYRLELHITATNRKGSLR